MVTITINIVNTTPVNNFKPTETVIIVQCAYIFFQSKLKSKNYDYFNNFYFENEGLQKKLDNQQSILLILIFQINMGT
jgi:hypothetical protein